MKNKEEIQSKIVTYKRLLNSADSEKKNFLKSAIWAFEWTLKDFKPSSGSKHMSETDLAHNEAVNETGTMLSTKGEIAMRDSLVYKGPERRVADLGLPKYRNGEWLRRTDL